MYYLISDTANIYTVIRPGYYCQLSNTFYLIRPIVRAYKSSVLPGGEISYRISYVGKQATDRQQEAQSSGTAAAGRHQRCL